MTSPLIILDRDGVINKDSDDYIKSVDEWHPIQGSIEAIADLSKAGYCVVVATNQSGLARGLFDEFTLAQIHELLHQLVEDKGGKIHGIFYCPHGPNDGCNCRKPATGLLEQIEKELERPIKNSFFIGDTTKDIGAARSAHCQPVLVLSGKGKNTFASLDSDSRNSIPVYNDLYEAARAILDNSIAHKIKGASIS